MWRLKLTNLCHAKGLRRYNPAIQCALVQSSRSLCSKSSGDSEKGTRGAPAHAPSEVQKHHVESKLRPDGIHIEADLEVTPKKRPRESNIVRQFETVNLPSSRTVTRERATLLARIKELFARHERTRAGFLRIVEEYKAMDKMRRGHPEFINTAVFKMDEFGVHKDLQCYQELINCFPKGRYVPQTILDEVWPGTYPQTEAAISLLRKMDRNGVVPSYELVESLSGILGWRSLASVLALEIGWWKSMFQDSDQYYIPSSERYRPFLMAGFVLKRMAGKTSSVQVVRSEPNGADGLPWVLATQTRRQISRAKNYTRTDLPVYVEGPQLIYMQTVPHYYYVLLLDAELSDADSDDPGERTAVSMCITPTGCPESVNTWIYSVKEKYPVLAECQIMFNQKPVPQSPYQCFSDVSAPLRPGIFGHSQDEKLKPDQQELDDRLLGDPF
ncbi:evolutionarily conserved signaling intermediate in Toll pathway, mitochondrial-like [Sycon ciliatum]|uniref:evolutionarily conserved signaling intermediate in Toll pathway, mitochondrial-like n=1 Tax=Sycon ciliatum TaxID=27933 RepID=UPI0020AB1B2D|eukprot:scpid51386/ scgid34196/ Evolutionarily conserved signaling intermediate in Toll pathway, mitochondrial